MTLASRTHRRPLVGGLVALVVASTAACGPLAPTDAAAVDPAPAGPAPSAPAHAADGSALAALALLEVKGRAPRTGYDRDLFAYREVDLDGNGCDVRNDVLRRDLVDAVLKDGTQGCVVQQGTLVDPYSGTTIPFTRGASTSDDVQIDHVVALSDAWQKGAQQLDEATRHRLGNDPLNLLAASGPLNQEKGDGDAATWLPPNTAFRCAYVARQVAVKYTFGLWVTQAEHDAIARILATCPEEPLPAGSAPLPGATDVQPPAAAAPAPAEAAPVEPPPAPDAAAPANPGNAVDCRDFATWAEADAWFRTYEPYYGDVAELDGNDDGEACESLPGAP
ncbi:HNH endonuclease family protein [Cellulomonas fimi]|uniref:GmrSD restriction endonucleases C-terminal domain-containing protein n=1 Tax=Cellulomonas fimi (strain ATCC 484 / DSM 20113 / JCM 1341 / CCUG 24087 / LMG 16345 / NBRC 15513 / NCIMB 8980 / NCTC 7547 / NRS-133) TaxID=590998 RepID=F4H3L3_CELFA|nr:HNH endonuclease family protein [Cellulomonas fimi]AEE47679.1 Domain of unknown function DUF1994 [Cellulomonas fimi ATCC 484]VEH36781.1 Domain of uncharacterised function (DUF1994) [Cellulomonas fimi]